LHAERCLRRGAKLIGNGGSGTRGRPGLVTPPVGVEDFAGNRGPQLWTLLLGQNPTISKVRRKGLLLLHALAGRFGARGMPASGEQWLEHNPKPIEGGLRQRAGRSPGERPKNFYLRLCGTACRISVMPCAAIYCIHAGMLMTSRMTESEEPPQPGGTELTQWTSAWRDGTDTNRSGFRCRSRRAAALQYSGTSWLEQLG